MVNFASLLTHIVKIEESLKETAEVRASIIVQAMLLKEFLHPLACLRMPELRHRGKQVVLDLEIQVRHPPVGDGMAVQIRRVVARVLDPMKVLIWFRHRQVSVRHGKVGENVRCTEEVVQIVDSKRLKTRISTEQNTKQKIVANDEGGELHGSLHRVSLDRLWRRQNTHHVAWVKVELPAASDKKARHRNEKEALELEPSPHDRPLGHLLTVDASRVERNERKRVEVYIVLKLLRSGVVLIVLVSPPHSDIPQPTP